MSSFLQRNLSSLQETEMKYIAEGPIIDEQNESNNGTEGNNTQELAEDKSWFENLSSSPSIQRILLNFNHSVCERLDAIEKKLDSVNEFCHALEEKVELLSSLVRESSSHQFLSSAASPQSTSSEDSTTTAMSLGSNFTVITLNTEADYPDGSWLGDENSQDMRVRTHINPTDLFHINTTCHTAEKMALTLLDYLFDRETQACSNISGKGKHKKKQLDPLMIFGIRCHLMHKFNLNNADWNRIKQNLDSKCRTAFRRKQKGLPLHPKSQKTILVPTDDAIDITMDESVPISENEILTCNNGQSIQLEPHCVRFSLQAVDEQRDLSDMLSNTQVIQTTHGEIRVLHATPEQLAEIQQTHQIQFLNDGHLLATPVEESSIDEQVVCSVDGNITMTDNEPNENELQY